ncbi:extensin family protein [Hansschlegelia sp.]|uniref:extensin-like domain-containing protein n=1 Tax=Hansschlegelia sp. TaxID=2041892 RepID=UPI002C975C6D|nr:extensin family protein [Hansschlegelia sp.]HVI27223.1 extensin family protein [Hansschlegelia sp.]
MIAGAVAGIVLSDLDRYAPLDLREPPGFLTQWRLRALSADPEGCLRVLRRSQVTVRRAPERRSVNSCGYADGVTLSGGALSDLPVMRCPLAAAVVAWERHVLQPAARSGLHAEIVGIRHLGAYSCRDIAGRPGRRSQHATGNALDVSAFELSDGSVVSVASDWSRGGGKAAFLREARTGACGLMAGVLSPDWNAAHSDHFHLDMGSVDICR